ncbi:AbgT family transporter [Nocardiopsis metallicus]|uniref:Aminobenzoyl-glutamate transport protein n=2 Tax=Nocardiopsis metallicus TaxID=179819 RepID=A0A840W721_9ACTN|nr:aminobenzoyl-glutamate transport protein [Nocardiopsis metallicus]
MTTTQDGSAKTPTRRMRLTIGALSAIERVGNKLPHPFWLFVIMAGLVILASVVLSALNVSVVSPADGEAVSVTSLLSTEGIHFIIGDAISNFAAFPPLPLIVAVMIGVSVAEQSGLITAALRGSVTRVPKKWLTFAVVLTGISASVASDAAYVVYIPLAAMVFKAVGRSPILGLVVGFGSVSAGYNAALTITLTDALMSGLSTSAAQIIDPDYVVNPLANFFFTFVSAIFLAIVITLLTELVLVKLSGNTREDEDAEIGDLGSMLLTDSERKGMRRAGLTLLVYFGLIAAVLAPPASPLRGEDGGVLSSPLLSGVAFVLAIAFLLVGIVYGRTTGSLPTMASVPPAMAVGVRELAPVLVLFFAAAQFIAYFSWSGMADVIAISGANFLDSTGVPPALLFIGFLVLAAVLNIFITSGSAQWALIAPVFIPMFMLMGISPETTQALYRIADSATNIISPMSAYFIMVLGLLQKYRKDAGVGTMISLTLPISITVFVSWTLFFFLWWGLGIPLGPGTPYAY